MKIIKIKQHTMREEPIINCLREALLVVKEICTPQKVQKDKRGTRNRKNTHLYFDYILMTLLSTWHISFQ